MIYLTDIDETVLQFNEPFKKWVRERGYETNDAFKLEESLNISREKTEELITDFHESSEEFLNLPVMPCAKDVLPDLYNDGVRFIAITAAVNSENVRKRRLKNLKNAFGFEWDDCICVGLGNSKKEQLARFDSTVWVDDSFVHAVSGYEVGHKSFLMCQPYNRNFSHPFVKRVKTWHEI